MSATTTQPVPATRPVAKSAARLPQSSSTKPAVCDSVMSCMIANGQPMSDHDLATFLGRHPSTVRGARERLAAAGMIKHKGFKRVGRGKAHMTWVVVRKGRKRNKAEALRKHILAGLHKISCLKRAISDDRKMLRQLEVQDTKRERAHAVAA